MLSTAIVIFREVLEAALILGVVLAATRGVPGRKAWVLSGTAVGVLASCVVAYFASAISGLAEGMGQEVFNAMILFSAAILIAWTVVWMSHHARKMTEELKRVGQEVLEGKKPLHTLSVVVFLAVLREGSEIVLFTYGILASGSAVLSVAVGSLLGFAGGAAAGLLIYYGLIKISPRHLFSVTSWLLAFLAAGMVSQGLGFLAGAGWVPELVPQLWDSSGFISEEGWIGMVLSALVGYTARPSGVQVLGYLLTLGGIIVLLKLTSPKKKNGALAKTAAAAVLLALLGAPQEAWATKKVYSPHVEKGELEIEARGSYDFDDRESKGAGQKQKYAVGYGFTDWWFTEVYGEWEKDPDSGKGLEFTAVDWENRFQISEPGAWWADTGLYLEYEFAAQSENADKIEGKLLLEKEFGEFVHILNLALEKEVNAPDGVEEEGLEGGLAWKGRYRWKESLEPGVEWFSSFGELEHTGSFDQQKHQVGPVIGGKLGSHVKYELGYLFGVSDAAPDGMLKWIFEWETRF